MRALILTVITLTSCGMDDLKKCDPNATTCETEGSEIKTAFKVSGSVSSAFGVTVDGASYYDIEDFYTEALSSIDASLETLGLEGYTAEFTKVELGFKDLTRNMDVFIEAVNSRGYSAKTTVRSDDTFSATFPAEASDDVYQIRAVKKIRVVATKVTEEIDEEGNVIESITTKNVCWNFSAIATNVDYTEVEKPAIISDFETRITAKDCEAAKAPFASK